MVIRRTAMAVYDTKYHLVWASKYRKWTKREDIREKFVAPDHVHVFLSFPPRYSIAHVVGMLKSISGADVFEKFPELERNCRDE